MRREWERRQEMYRAWMEHDSARAQSAAHDHGEHDHVDDHHEHDQHSHHPHPHHGAEQAFERGFERGFLRGVERGTPFGHAGHGFGPGGFGYGGFGRGRYGRGFGPGRFGPEAFGHEHFGHGRPPFAGRHGFEGRCRGSVDRILADFVERGWVWFDGDRATLTDEGRAAHDAASERVDSVRATVAEGIDPADLATTLATLEAMARNLGWTPSAAQPDDAAEGNNADDTDTGTAAD
ncbi:hypothetical protein ACRAWC_13680 [Leifsonia sp. L25]|uniref:hypothetical protein n=1 Tax=Actinomycetes TaxID=1760 RepID=UPI003D682839